MRQPHIPPMPEGFTDRAAWDAIHWQFSEQRIDSPYMMSVLDRGVVEWQRANQDRVRAAMEAKSRQGD